MGSDAHDGNKGGCAYFMHSRSLTAIDGYGLSYPYNSGTRVRRVFTDQADIACTKREADFGTLCAYSACISDAASNERTTIAGGGRGGGGWIGQSIFCLTRLPN